MYSSAFQEALTFAQQVSKPHSPYDLCRTLGIDIISDKPLHKDGYLVCCDGRKLIFINSLIQNLRGTPKFCVKSNECRNRANLYVGGSGLTVCRLCLQHNAGGDGCQGR